MTRRPGAQEAQKSRGAKHGFAKGTQGQVDEVTVSFNGAALIRARKSLLSYSLSRSGAISGLRPPAFGSL